MQLEEVQYRDQVTNKISIFRAKSESKVTLICLPALGIRASYYETFAKALVDIGCHVITADYRGHGHSSVRPSSKVNFGYQELIDDVDEIVNRAKTLFPNTKMVIVGHSLGGQIGSLYAAKFRDEVDGLILVTACLVHYKGWKGWSRFKVLMAGITFFTISKMVGYFPGNLLSFGGKEGRQLMGDWSYNALHGQYRIANSNFDYESALQQTKMRILSITIKQDWMASYTAAKNLYMKFNEASSVEHLHVGPEETQVKNLNHFNWAKNPRYFAKVIQDWLQE